MDYNEFAEKIKSKYPDYADMNNLDLAKKMVSKFPEEYGDVTFEQPKTYKEQAPGLLTRVKASGYSGLSDDDKRLFDAQYPHSQASKRMTLDEARRLTDEEVAKSKVQPKPQSEEKGLYQKVREIIVPEVAQTLSPFEYWKDRIFSEGKQTAEEVPYAQYVEDNIEAGNKGEGIVGMIGDPVTTAQIIASGVTGGLSVPVEAAIGGIGNVASYYGNNDFKDTNWKDALISAGIGSILGGLGAKITGSPTRRVAERESKVAGLKSESESVGEMLGSENAVLSKLEEQHKTLGVGSDGKPSVSSQQVYGEMSKNLPSTEQSERLTELSDIIERETNEFGDLSTEGLRAYREQDQILSSDPKIIKNMSELWKRTSENRAALSQLDEKIDNGVSQGISKEKISRLKSEKLSIENSLKELEKSPYYPLLGEYVNRKIGGVLFNSPIVGTGISLVRPVVDRVGKVAPIRGLIKKVQENSPTEWISSTKPEQVGALLSNISGKYTADKTLKVKKQLTEAAKAIKNMEDRRKGMWGKK